MRDENFGDYGLLMRVLFTGAPGVGHLFPLAALAAAAMARGHEVLVASLPGGEVVADTGVPFVIVAPGVDWRTELRRRGAVELAEPLARALETNGADRDAFVQVAALVNDTVTDDVVDLALRWRPDMIVYEYLFPAGLVAAARLGVAAVQHDLGLIRTDTLRRLMVEQLAPTLDRHGVDGQPDPLAVLDLAPPSMAPEQERGWRLRPVSPPDSRPVPPWLTRHTDRPRIAVTLGTVPPRLDGVSRIDRVVTAAARMDAEIVLVMGHIDVSELGGLPANVRALGWVPWDRVVAVSDAVVHHGGCGTTLAAAAAGIPQLVLPDGSDRFVNADAVHKRGIGLRAAAAQIDTDLLGRLLTDGGLAAAAAEVAIEVAAMPAPEAVVSRLADLTG